MIKIIAILWIAIGLYLVDFARRERMFSKGMAPQVIALALIVVIAWPIGVVREGWQAMLNTTYAWFRKR